MARVESDSDDSTSSSGSSSSSRSSRSSRSSDDEERAAAAERAVAEGNGSYADHVRLLSALRRRGDDDATRAAYERLSEACPLAPADWLRRLGFELERSDPDSAEDRLRLRRLFEAAAVDCHSHRLHSERIAFARLEPDEDADESVRAALRSAGSDPVDGAALWEAARDIKTDRLRSPDAPPDELDRLAAQVFLLFRGQLERPVLQPGPALEPFEEFLEGAGGRVPDLEAAARNVREAHRLAREALPTLLAYESELEENDGTGDLSARCDTYVRYIRHAEGLRGDGTEDGLHSADLLAALYDRLTSECFAPAQRGESAVPARAEELCVEYVEFAREHGSEELLTEALERVVRRCPRKSSLWTLKLRHLERSGAEFVRIKDEFEKALFGGFDTPEEYVDLWLCYLEALRRKTDFASPDRVDILRKTFRLSWDSLSQLWGDEADKEFTILQFWARVEYQLVKDHEYGQELFREILDYGDNKKRGGLWLEYVRMERLRNDASKLREIFRKAVRASPDPRLQHAWLSHERDFGSLDTLTECLKISSERAEEWEREKSKNAHGSGGAFAHHKQKFNNRKSQTNNTDGSEGRKEKFSKRASDKTSPRKRPHSKEPYDEERGEERPKRKNLTRISDKLNGNQNESESVSGPVKRKIDGANEEQSASKKSKRTFADEEEKNKCTAFISNLNFKVDEGALRSKLSRYGQIAEIRLVTGVKKFGSICYCVFENEKSVDAAIADDRTLFEDRPMFISRYRSSAESKKKHFSFSTQIERNKLYVKNIPFEYCTEEKLRDIFSKYGDLKDIRVVTFKTGKPKGTAYIDYSDDKSASSAVTALDGTEVGGRTVGVAISAPPPRKGDIEKPSTSSSLRGHARTQLFVPSVLQKQVNKKSEPGPTASSAVNKLSNTDFRNMILGEK